MRRICLTLIFILFCSGSISAQFRTDRTGISQVTAGTVTGPPGSETAQSQANSDETPVEVDSLQGFSLKRMIRGYARKDTLTPPYMLLGTAIIPGAAQTYNRQYLKVPLIYAGIGAGVYSGIHFGNQYKESGESKYKWMSLAGYVGAGAVYWGQLLDGVVNFKTDIKAPVPAKSTLYSALLPGLGQAYNGDWWKIPIWYGGFVACGYFYHINDMEYRRFKYIVDMDRNKQESGYTGSINANQATTYRDQYRRYRDYSILATFLVYALNVIDANVFSYMADFEVDDNIARLEMQPAVMQPLTSEFAFTSPSHPAFGLNLNISF